MGEEVSGYIGRLVTAMSAAYGAAWNIAARGESPTIDDRAWQVQVGYSDFQPRRNGVLVVVWPQEWTGPCRLRVWPCPQP